MREDTVDKVMKVLATEARRNQAKFPELLGDLREMVMFGGQVATMAAEMYEFKSLEDFVEAFGTWACNYATIDLGFQASRAEDPDKAAKLNEWVEILRREREEHDVFENVAAAAFLIGLAVHVAGEQKLIEQMSREIGSNYPQ